MKQIISAFIVILLIGCKPKQTVATAAANENTAVKKIINGHYQNKHYFFTLNIGINLNPLIFCNYSLSLLYFSIY